MRYVIRWFSGFLIVVGTASASVAGVVNEIYPDLAGGILTRARIGNLPEGILLKSEGVEVTADDLQNFLQEQPPSVRAELDENLFFVLEQHAAEKLLSAAARTAMEKKGLTPPPDEQKIIQSFFEELSESVTVAGPEQKAFYDSNPQFFPGVPFEQVRSQIERFLTQEKKQHFIEDYIRDFGNEIPVEVAVDWTAKQAEAAMNNPLDQARKSGTFTLALFNATTPCCPDTMSPVIASLRTRFAERLTAVSFNPNTQPILAARYGIRGNPFLIFYGQDGKELFRNPGAMSLDDLTTKLAEFGLE